MCRVSFNIIRHWPSFNKTHWLTSAQMPSSIHWPLLWSPRTWEQYFCNSNLKGFSSTTSFNIHLERWIGDLCSLILMGLKLSTINNPSNREPGDKDYLKEQEQALPSSPGMIHQCLQCVREGLSHLCHSKFSLCIWHFTWYDLRLFTLSSLFHRGWGTTPVLARSHSVTAATFVWLKINKRAFQDRRHRKPRQVLEKAKNCVWETFLKESSKLAMSPFLKRGPVVSSSDVFNAKVKLHSRGGLHDENMNCAVVEPCMSKSLTSRSLMLVEVDHELTFWS